jgi:hypothetical protein
MVACLFVNLEVVSNFFDPLDPFNAGQKAIDFALEYWATESYVATFRGNFDSAWVRYYPPKL